MSFHEIISPGEEARFEGYAAELRAMQKVPRRALHAKQHLGAEGRLEVAALPAQLRVAVFAEPKTWPVYLRFSNGSGRQQHDGIPDVRGIAVKLRGVPGRKIIKGLEDKKTQDFLFIHTPATPFRTPDEFVAFVRIAAKGKALLVPRIFAALGSRRALQVLRELRPFLSIRRRPSASAGRRPSWPSFPTRRRGSRPSRCATIWSTASAKGR